MLSRIGDESRENAYTESKKGGITVKKEEKEPVNWEVKDPQLPVVKSGPMDNQRR